MSTGRICAFFATMVAVSVDPAVPRGVWGQRLGTSTASTGAAPASASAAAAAATAIVSSMIWSVGKL